MTTWESGILPALFRSIFHLNGAVVAPAYDPTTGQHRYLYASNESECTVFQTLQPGEADPEDLYRLAKLNPDITLFIIASPCHLVGLHSRFPNLKRNWILFCCSCNGVLSPIALQTYFNVLSNDRGIPVINYNLAAKHYGASVSRVEFQHKDRTLTAQYDSLSPFKKAYRTGALQRPSCYFCDYRYYNPWLSDLTLFPVSFSQYPNFAPEDKSVSLLCVNSITGQRLFEQSKDFLIWKELSKEEVANSLPTAAIPLTAARPSLFERLRTAPPEAVYAPFNKK